MSGSAGGEEGARRRPRRAARAGEGGGGRSCCAPPSPREQGRGEQGRRRGLRPAARRGLRRSRGALACSRVAPLPPPFGEHEATSKHHSFLPTRPLQLNNLGSVEHLRRPASLLVEHAEVQTCSGVHGQGRPELACGHGRPAQPLWPLHARRGLSAPPPPQLRAPAAAARARSPQLRAPASTQLHCPERTAASPSSRWGHAAEPHVVEGVAGHVC